MNKSTWRIISKIGLLMVIIGFFMPMACNQNGFKIAEYSSNMASIAGSGGTNYLGISLYSLFIFSCLGIVLLLMFLVKKSVNIGLDWLFLVGSLVSAFIVFGKFNDFSKNMFSGIGSFYWSNLGSANILQSGSYLIITGLIISTLSLIIASTRKVDNTEMKNNLENNNGISDEIV